MPRWKVVIAVTREWVGEAQDSLEAVKKASLELGNPVGGSVTAFRMLGSSKPRRPRH